MNIHISEKLKTPNMINSKIYTHKHFIAKLSKTEDKKNLEDGTRKVIYYVHQ